MYLIFYFNMSFMFIFSFHIFLRMILKFEPANKFAQARDTISQYNKLNMLMVEKLKRINTTEEDKMNPSPVFQDTYFKT